MDAKKQHGGARKGAGRKPINPEGRTIVVAATVPEMLVAKLDAVVRRIVKSKH